MVGDSFAMPKNNRDKLRHFFEYDAHALSHIPKCIFACAAPKADAHLDRSAAAALRAHQQCAAWQVSGTPTARHMVRKIRRDRGMLLTCTG